MSQRFSKYALPLILVWTSLVYGPTFHNGFNMDDSLYVHKRHDTISFWEASCHILTQPTFTEIDGTRHEYRPVSALVLLVQQRVFGNFAEAYHAVSLLLYLSLLVLLWRLARHYFAAASKDWVAVALLLFAVHPIHVEVVCSIKNQEELLVALLGFGALWAFVRYRSGGQLQWLVAVGLLLCLAALAKKNALLFVPVLLLLTFQKGEFKSRRNQGLCVGTLLMVLLLFVGIHDNLEAGERLLVLAENPLQGKGWNQHWGTGFAFVTKYLGLLFFPYPLVAYYGYGAVQIKTLPSFPAVLGILLLSAATLVGLWAYIKGMRWSVLLLSAAGSLFAVCGFVEVFPGLFAERFVFVPSVFLIAILVMCFRALAHQLRMPNPVALTILGVLGLALGSLTLVRAQQWKDMPTLFEADLAHNPSNRKMHFELAQWYSSGYLNDTLDFDHRDLNYRRALQHAIKAHGLLPDQASAGMLERLYCLSGDEKRCVATAPSGAKYLDLFLFAQGRADTLLMIRYRTQLLKFEPTDLQSYQILNRLYFGIGQTENGKHILEQAIKKFPETPLGYAEYANYYLAVRDTASALPYIEKAAPLSPKNPGVLHFLIDYYSKRDLNDKVMQYNELLKKEY